MKNSIIRILIFSTFFFVFGCAKTYKPINPKSLEYNLHSESNNLKLSYRYDVLREKGNIKYANKERKNGLKIIAVEIKNNTDSVVTIGKDVHFSTGKSFVFPMEPADLKYYLKQNTPSYLSYLLLSILQYRTQNGNYVDIYQIGLLIGPPITIDNMLTASKANKNFLNELEEYHILNKEIAPGQTIYGLIGVRDIDYYPLTIKNSNM